MNSQNTSVYLQLSGVQALINLSIIAILSHALQTAQQGLLSVCHFSNRIYFYLHVLLTLAGVWDRSVLTELEEEQWDPVFVSVPDKRRFLDSGELDICVRLNIHWSLRAKQQDTLIQR